MTHHIDAPPPAPRHHGIGCHRRNHDDGNDDGYHVAVGHRARQGDQGRRPGRGQERRSDGRRCRSQVAATATDQAKQVAQET